MERTIKVGDVFRQDGYDRKVVQREKDIVLVEVICPLHNHSYSWEVHKLKIRRDYTSPKGKHYNILESIRTARYFGYYAWAYQNKENALLKFKEVLV